MESNNQQLATRLADLGERLDRIERNAPVAAGSVLAKLEQLSERLDRMERGAAVALRPAQPAALRDKRRRQQQDQRRDWSQRQGRPPHLP